jgi:hypothetical protein
MRDRPRPSAMCCQLELIEVAPHCLNGLRWTELTNLTGHRPRPHCVQLADPGLNLASGEPDDHLERWWLYTHGRGWAALRQVTTTGGSLRC